MGVPSGTLADVAGDGHSGRRAARAGDCPDPGAQAGPQGHQLPGASIGGDQRLSGIWGGDVPVAEGL